MDGFNSTFSKPPHFTTLKLASCNLRKFPDLRNHSKFLTYLDLSQNQIQGEIPNWVWMISSSFLMHLNLSHNLLVGLQQLFSNFAPYLCLHLTYIPTCSMDESPPHPNFPTMWITQTTTSSLPSQMILVLTCPSLFSSLFQRIKSRESCLHPSAVQLTSKFLTFLTMLWVVEYLHVWLRMRLLRFWIYGETCLATLYLGIFLETVIYRL